MLGLTARNYFHRERLRIDTDGLDWRLSALVTIYHRRIPWEHLVAIQSGSHYGARAVISGWGIGVETDESTFYLFLDMNHREEGKILERHLKKFVDDYRKRHAIPSPTHSSESNGLKRRRELLTLHETPEYLGIAGAPDLRRENRVMSLIIMIGWTIGCIALSFGLFSMGENANLWIALVFVAVFWSTWLFIVPTMLMMFWRWETLRIDATEVEYRIAIRLPLIFLTVWCRRIPLLDLGLAEKYSVKIGNDMETGIEIPTTGLTIRCFKTRQGTCTALSFLGSINARLRQCGVTEKSRFQTRKERLGGDKPLDFRWAIHEEGTVQKLTRTGRVSAGSMGKLLFVCVFINSIVSLFMVSAIGMWMEKTEPLFVPYAIAILVFPFLILGIFALGTTILSFLQFICRYEIKIYDYGVRHRRSWFGIGRSRFWAYSDFGKVAVLTRKAKLRMIDAIRNPEMCDTSDGMTNPYPFAVQFSDSEDKLLDMIRDLLEGEARWIASQIRESKKKKE